MKLTNIKICINIVLFFFCLQITVFAQTTAFTSLIVNNTRDHLLLFLNLNTEHPIKKKIKEAVESGIPITFSFIITLNKFQNLQLNQNIVKSEILHSMQFDNIKNIYIVKRSWEKNRQNTTKSFAEALRLMGKISSLKVVSLKMLKKGEKYQIRVKSELIKQALPFRLHHILFFFSKWNFKTDWHMIDFIY